MATIITNQETKAVFAETKEEEYAVFADAKLTLKLPIKASSQEIADEIAQHIAFYIDKIKLELLDYDGDIIQGVRVCEWDIDVVDLEKK